MYLCPSGTSVSVSLRYKCICVHQVPGCEGGSVSVLVAADSLARLARDVVRMTEGEMYGIRSGV